MAVIIQYPGLALIAAALSAQTAGVFEPGAKLTHPAEGFSITAGPAAAQGNVYFTDQPNNRILKWSTDGKLSTFHESPRPRQRPLLRE